jgi:hypothetical protein
MKTLMSEVLAKIKRTDNTQETKLIRLRDFSDEGNSLTMGL